jgi:electron transfer flavoprotein-quinone oxidoreductase
VIILTNDVEAIVVGAGFAGSSAAIKLAQSGKNVVLLDRGSPIGSKNLSGGVLWGNDLAEILPNWKEEAPIERWVLNKKVGFLSEEDATVLDFHFDEWKHTKVGASVLRAKFDVWLANQAEEAGAAVHPGINVDRLLIDDGKVTGVESRGETLEAPIVIITDGANSRLTMQAGLRKHKSFAEEIEMHATGYKEVLQLDQEEINKRFSLDNNTGVAGEFVLGNQQSKVKAGGFFYTNESSISLGVVIHLDSLSTDDLAYDVYESFRNHPYIDRLVEGSERIEYGAHLIPEGGYNIKAKLYGDGFMVSGDAAGFLFANGLVIQGMNYAAKGGILAGETAIEALDKKNYSKSTLSLYNKKLNNCYIMKDLKRFKKVSQMTKNQNLFSLYPRAINDAFKTIMSEKGEPKLPMYRSVLKTFKQHGAGMFTLMKDGLGARRL